MDALSLDVMMELERRGWDALCSRAGASFYGPLLTEDAVMVLVNGAVLDREAVVRSLDQAPGWDTYEITDARRVRLGAGSAALVYRATARRGEEPPFEGLMTSAYVMVQGAPRLALYTQTTATH